MEYCIIYYNNGELNNSIFKFVNNTQEIRQVIISLFLINVLLARPPIT